jgi:hypothetical protein
MSNPPAGAVSHELHEIKEGREELREHPLHAGRYGKMMVYGKTHVLGSRKF